MAEIKSDHGIVVDHNETDIRYAVTDAAYDSTVSTYVRDLKPGEAVHNFQPKPRLVAEEDDAAALEAETEEAEPEYDSFTVGELKDEIEARNADLPEDAQIVPSGTLKADLIAALEADDERDSAE